MRPVVSAVAVVRSRLCESESEGREAAVSKSVVGRRLCEKLVSAWCVDSATMTCDVFLSPRVGPSVAGGVVVCRGCLFQDGIHVC
jgi:hypothetical protein